MTYEEIISKVKKEFGSADVSNYEGHLALQINITGEGAGAFYTEINDGQLSIEPFDYKDNDAMLTADGEDIVSILSGKLNAADALESGKLSVEGDFAKAFSIQPIIEGNKKPAAKKRIASKPASKSAPKAAAAKTVTKTPAKSAATAKSSVKTEPKTTAKAAKTTAKKG